MLFVLILILISAILLVLVVLAQNSKGGGLSSQFGGSGASNLIGVKKTSDLLEKLTWGFAIAVLVLSMAFNVMVPNPNAADQNSINLDRAGEQAQPAPLPSLDATEGTAGDEPTSSQPTDDGELDGLTDDQ